jgi:uncharacterized membrane protein YeiB
VNAAIDILHFLFVFGVIFVCYAIAGMVVFGSQLHEFSAFHFAVFTSFKTLMGDFDFGGLFAVSKPAAMIWFWSFNILVLLVMLNMLLAIVMDQYTAVKGNAQDATTLVAQTTTLMRRQRENKLGKRRELSDVLHILESKEWTGGDEMSVQILCDNVENLPTNQAKRTLGRCRKWMINRANREEIGLSHVITQVCHLDQALHSMAEQQLEVMSTLSQACDGLALESALDTKGGSQKLNTVLAKEMRNPYLDDIKEIMMQQTLAIEAPPPTASPRR